MSGSLNLVGNANINGTLTYVGKLMHRIVVSPSGSFTTLKDAVDYFNASAASDTEILLDAGIHLITDTVTVNNSSYSLQIRGLSYGVTALHAATGLTNKPMFNIRSHCDINKITASGASLLNYGTAPTENFINFDTTNAIYSEVTDIFIDTFNIAIYDTAGTNIFIFNFAMSDCTTAGIRINTANSNAYLDCEVGSFANNAISIDLLKANTGGFLIDTSTFNNSSGQTSIKYTGGAGNYINAGVCQITGCSYNGVGTFITGFDFSLTTGRDANIIVMYNTGEENKNPHAKINVLNNSSSVVIPGNNIFIKSNFTASSTYTTKWTIENNRAIYQPSNVRDALMWINANVICTNQNNRNIDIGIVKNSLTSSGIFGQMTCRAANSAETYPISTNVYLEDCTSGSYYEIWVSSANAADQIILQDINWLIEAR